MSQDTAAPRGLPPVVVEETAAVPTHSLFSRLAAEVFGTFVVVLAIIGTLTFNFVNQGSFLPVALAGGIALMAAVAAVGHVSGGHFNLAVSFGMALVGRLGWVHMLGYWLAQLVGAALAALVLWAIIPASLPEAMGAEGKSSVLQSAANGFGSHSPLATLSQGATEFTMWAALLVEIVATAVLVGVIFGTMRDRTAGERTAERAIGERTTLPYSAVVAGLTLTALYLVVWPVTNASLNPARSFAPALFGGGWTWNQLWLFLVAPLVGAALAALFYKAFAPATGDDEIEVAELGDRYDVAPADDEVVEPRASAQEPGETTAEMTSTEPVRTDDDRPEGPAGSSRLA